MAADEGRDSTGDRRRHLRGPGHHALAGFPEIKSYLREHQPPTRIVWGPHDGYMPEGSARAYLCELPSAERHLLDGGHWALETNLDEIVVLIRDFLGRVRSSSE